MGVLLKYYQYVYINRGFEVHFNFKMPYTTSHCSSYAFLELKAL